MDNLIENNLFYYATKELSQDAFICWLMSFAKAGAKEDQAIKECAIRFIKEFIPELKETDKICVTDIKHQYKNIDVLLAINDEYVVIIEDKTYSKEHDDQLKRYAELIKKENKYEKLKIKKVYYKIGFQSDYSEVQQNEYLIFDRSRIIQVIEPYKDQTSNQILHDYYDYIKNFEDEATKFNDKPIEEWTWIQINGYYNYLKQSGFFDNLGFECNYGYVSNPKGGFYAMWIYNQNYHVFEDMKYELYLQLEYVDDRLNICLKVSIQVDKQSKEHMNPKKLREFLVCNDKLKKKFKKPARYGKGKTMTIGIYCEDFTDSKSLEDIEEIITDATHDFNKFSNGIKDKF